MRFNVCFLFIAKIFFNLSNYFWLFFLPWIQYIEQIRDITIPCLHARVPQLAFLIKASEKLEKMLINQSEKVSF
jgi:hypothetical protein